MNKAVFLDRDGTINVEKHYLYRIEDFEFLPGAVDGMRLFQKMGYMIVIISNQSGIARGFYTEDDLRMLNEWLTRTLKERGVDISGIYYCPHLPDAAVAEYRCDCSCRKPKTGLFHKAAEELDIDLSRSIVIGDRERDIRLASEIEGCRGYMVNDDFTLADAAENLIRISAGIL